ncbi:MAG: hypothetical protein MP439_06705 [Ferrimicrobium sp.]|nr:hypothetical protein [Ferrimicrobium sp.]
MTTKQLELFEASAPANTSEFRRLQGLHGVAKLRQSLATTGQRNQDVA